MLLMTLTRKSVLLAAMAMPLAACAAAPSTAASKSPSSVQSARRLRADEQFTALERQHQASVGVFMLDTGSGDTVSWRADRRFAFCSTHKVFTAAAVLHAKDNDVMGEVIHYTVDDLVPHSPVTSEHVDTGMTLTALCDAAIRQSDNTAANLLFAQLKGPAGFQRALHDIGDAITRSDRTEPNLNTAVPGDDRDTTTPAAFAGTLQKIVRGDWLTASKRVTLLDWMSDNAITDTLIRAGLPEGWSVADKSGGGDYGTRNDIGIIDRPKGAPIVLAVMSTKPDGQPDSEWDDALIAAATRAAIATGVAAE
jgi:beta-lactamase class A